ncbi:6517_t:CDS:2, partial [Acaulospora colombiana]
SDLNCMENQKHLHNLNEAQHSAGPGSGKTRTLTCRIAHLINVHKIDPSQIVAVTFTNKAANELRVRLESLIGEAAVSSLVLDETKKLIAAILKEVVSTEESHSSNGKKAEIKDSFAADIISKAKSKGLTPEQLYAKAMRDQTAKRMLPKGEIDPSTALDIFPIYSRYVEECQKNNALDFDDLLTYGAKLLKAKPDCIDCRHILVDEFQDTNTTQFQLMTLFAARHGNISIVGDPDQSKIENLARMITLFPKTRQICLEDNYRSTGAILAASMAIIEE